MARKIAEKDIPGLKRQATQEMFAEACWLAAIRHYTDGHPDALVRFLRGNVPRLPDSSVIRVALADLLLRLSPRPHHRQKISRLQQEDMIAQLQAIDRVIELQLKQVPDLEQRGFYPGMERQQIRAAIYAGKKRMIRALSSRSGIRPSTLKKAKVKRRRVT